VDELERVSKLRRFLGTYGVAVGPG
jgi:hypothetical protein